jgi:hypothetical protein
MPSLRLFSGKCYVFGCVRSTWPCTQCWCRRACDNCLTLNLIIFILHYAAPLQDVRQAVRRGTLGSLNPTPWAVMTGNCTGWYVVGHVIRLRFHISLEWLTLSLSWKLQGHLLVFNSGRFEYYQKWFTFGYDDLIVLTNLLGRINSYFGQMHQASYFRYGWIWQRQNSNTVIEWSPRCVRHLCSC